MDPPASRPAGGAVRRPAGGSLAFAPPRAWAAEQAQHGRRVTLAPSQAERRRLPTALRRPVAVLRNRIETTLGEITDVVGLGLARHGAKTFWGLLTRTAATLLAHTLLRLALV